MKKPESRNPLEMPRMDVEVENRTFHTYFKDSEESGIAARRRYETRTARRKSQISRLNSNARIKLLRGDNPHFLERLGREGSESPDSRAETAAAATTSSASTRRFSCVNFFLSKNVEVTTGRLMGAFCATAASRRVDPDDAASFFM
jgi:hypothetical protein